MNHSTLTKASDYVLGTAELTSVITGLILNPLAIPHFFHHRAQLPNLLYLFITVTDILILAACFPTSLSMLNRKAPVLLENRTVCLLSGFVFNVFSRMSVFLIAMLSVARTIKLVFPFTAIKSRIYLAVLAVYFCLNVCLAGLPLLFSNARYYFAEFFAQCTWGLNELSFVNSTDSPLWYGMTYTTIILPWLLPGLIVIISCFASVTVLLSSSSRMKGSRARGQSDNGMRQATVTILLMTMVYIAFNVPCWVVYCYLISTEFDTLSWMTSINVDQLQVLFIVVGRTSVALNSATNPVLYLCRMNLLRERLRVSRAAVLIKRQLVRRGWWYKTVTPRISSPLNDGHTRPTTPVVITLRITEPIGRKVSTDTQGSRSSHGDVETARTNETPCSDTGRRSTPPRPQNE